MQVPVLESRNCSYGRRTYEKIDSISPVCNKMKSNQDGVRLLVSMALACLMSWGYAHINPKEHPPVLVPVQLIGKDKAQHSLDNHTTQLCIPVALYNGTVVVAGQEVEPEDPVNINILVPLQLYSPEGVVLSSTGVTTEARALVLEAHGHGVHLYRLQLLVTSIDSREVMTMSVPEVRLYLGDDGAEKRRSVALLKPENSALVTPQDSANTDAVADVLSFIPVSAESNSEETHTYRPQITITMEPKLQQELPMNHGKTSILCHGGCPNGLACLRPDPIVCSELPPAMRLAICAVLLCLAAFLLMLFVHVFIVRPSSAPSRSSSLYAQNMRAAWLDGYVPIFDKEACA